MHGLSATLSLLALTATTLVSAHSDTNAHRHSHHRRAGTQHLQKRFSGEASFYNVETGNEVACGGYGQNSGYTVALSVDQWDGGSHCGQTVSITANGKTIQATIRDQCPSCWTGKLDLTPGLFSAFADQSQGIIPITWNFGGASEPAPPPSSSKPAWTPSSTWKEPEYTPSSTSRWSSSSQWTPPASSSTHWSSSSQWTPSSSSSRWSSSSQASSSSSSWTPSSSSSVSASSTGVNSTSTAAANTTSSASASTSSTVAPAETGVTGTSNVSGALQDLNQVVLNMAGMVVTAADVDSADA